MRLLGGLALIAAVVGFWPYITYYVTLWIHAQLYLTMAVFAIYGVLLVRSARARRFVLVVLNVVTLGIVGAAIAGLRRT